MKRVLFFCLLVIVSIFGKGQVNLQTGSATFTLPMFNWQDDKSRLNSVVALNYNSGTGLKVDDVASNMGQGWSLVAGGVITRMQVGEPDDQIAFPGGQETVKDKNKYPNGYLLNPDDVYNKGCPDALTKYPLFEDKNHMYKQHNLLAMDRELDYFSFQFNGRSGMFVLNKNSDENCLVLGDSKLRISFARDYSMTNNTKSGIRTFITAFTITDENGLTYRFSKHGLNKVLKRQYCDRNQAGEQTQPHFKGRTVYYEKDFDDNNITNPYVINSWYLTGIEDVLTHRKITFSYNKTLNIDNSAGASIAYYSEKDYSIISYKFSRTQIPQLSSIAYQDGHLVTFTYGTRRVDLNNDEVLSSVDISYNSRFLSRYQLQTTYFILNRYGTPVSPYQQKVARLCLRSVKKIGVDLKAEENPYFFDYYLTSKNANTDDDDYIPPPFSPFKDVWGFFNGNKSLDYDGKPILSSLNNPAASYSDVLTNNRTMGLCFLRQLPSGTIDFFNTKTGYAKNGLLKQIIYPTGGTLTYEYEQNIGRFPGQSQDQAVGGVHVSKTSVTDGGYSNGCANPIVTNYNYVLNAAGNPSSLWGLETLNNSMSFLNHYEPEKNELRPWPTGCSYKYQYPGILSSEDKTTLTTRQEVMQATSTISNILSVINTVRDIANFTWGGGGWIPLTIDIVSTLVDVALSCSAHPESDFTSTVYYNSDLNAGNPLPIQFKRVEVVSGTGTIGKTVQEFTSSDDYSIWEPENRSFSMKQRYAYWAYGLPRLTTVYDVNGYKVRETENQYDFSNAKQTALTGKLISFIGSCKGRVLKSTSQRNTEWEKAIYEENNTYATPDRPNQDLLVEPYYVYTGRVENTDTYERIFKPNSSKYLETITSYKYNPKNYKVNNIATKQSNGDINYQEILYSCDFTGAPFNLMNQSNIIETPVESISSVQKNGAPSILKLTSKHTDFIQLVNGDIKPSRVLEQRYDQPGNPTNSKEIQTFIYDGITGNLIGMKDEGSHIVTNIYDYSDKYIIASVINADPLLDKPAYTSFETQNFGGWTLTGSPGYSSSAVTGARAFLLSAANSLKVMDLNASKFYRVSFWASNAVTVTGGTKIKSAPTINGLTYYEYDVASGNTSVTVSGSATIDELRLYPKTARMRTVTYDEIIGKTSECDENNRIAYYEYDELGRQKFVKDEYKNILKMYEYNTVSNKQSGCPGTYTNNNITEIFTKNNCSAGYIGGDVKYTVPAGKYSSTISQQDADQKAENEINANGQAYANANGTCIKLYYNVALSKSFTTQGCDVGSSGGTVTYSVPANKYTSTVSQSDADQMAQDEIDANGQAYANSSENRVCNVSTLPDWRADNPQLKCETDGSGNTGHQLALLTDVNPNSSSYGQTAWKDVGPDLNACPVTQYSPVLQNPSCNGSSSSYKMYGNTGDIVVLTLSFSGVVQWTGSGGGAGAYVSLACSGKSCSNASPHIMSTSSTGFTTSCTITFTMPSNSVIINTNAVLNNSATSGTASANLQLVSVNGVARDSQTLVCSGTSSGSW